MMDIRDEIESYISLLAPKGVVISKEEKANLFFFLSWPETIKMQHVSILLKFNFEVEFENSNRKEEILNKIFSYLVGELTRLKGGLLTRIDDLELDLSVINIEPQFE
jgi:hypothetical protein